MRLLMSSLMLAAAAAESLAIIDVDGATVRIADWSTRTWTTPPQWDADLLETAGVWRAASAGRVCALATGGVGPGAPAAKQKRERSGCVARLSATHVARPWRAVCDDDNDADDALSSVDRVVVAPGRPRSGTTWLLEHFEGAAAARRGDGGAPLATRSETNYLQQGDVRAAYLGQFANVGEATRGLFQKGMWALEWPLYPWRVRALLGAKRRAVKAVLVVRDEAPRARSRREKFKKNSPLLGARDVAAAEKFAACAGAAYANATGLRVAGAFPTREWLCALWRLPDAAFYAADLRLAAECTADAVGACRDLHARSAGAANLWSLSLLRWAKALGPRNVFLAKYEAAVANYSSYREALERFAGVGPLAVLPPRKQGAAARSKFDVRLEGLRGVSDAEIAAHLSTPHVAGSPLASLWCPAAAPSEGRGKWPGDALPPLAAEAACPAEPAPRRERRRGPARPAAARVMDQARAISRGNRRRRRAPR